MSRRNSVGISLSPSFFNALLIIMSHKQQMVVPAFSLITDLYVDEIQR